MRHGGLAASASSLEVVPHGRHSDLPVACHRGAIAIPSFTTGDEIAMFAARQGMMTALDLVRQSAVLMDAAGMVVNINDAAHAMIGDGVSLAHGRLRAATRSADAALQALVLRTASMQTGSFVARSVALPRWPRRPLIAQATTLAAATFGVARILVTMKALDPPEDIAIGPLVEAFGLTNAETRLARYLASGQGLAYAATELGVSISTVRTHLKAIFSKTQTHSQTELAWLFARGTGLDRVSTISSR